MQNLNLNIGVINFVDKFLFLKLCNIYKEHCGTYQKDVFKEHAEKSY